MSLFSSKFKNINVEKIGMKVVYNELTFEPNYYNVTNIDCKKNK